MNKTFNVYKCQFFVMKSQTYSFAHDNREEKKKNNTRDEDKKRAAT